MTLENTNIYAIVGVNTNESEILSVHLSYEVALDAAKLEMDTNEDYCLIKIERLA